MGDALRISATPTLFINGRRLVGVVSFEQLKMVVDEELTWAKTSKKATDCCSVQLSLPGSAPSVPLPGSAPGVPMPGSSSGAAPAAGKATVK
jgi:hypothetical protein